MSVVVLLGVAMIATWTWALWPQSKDAAPGEPSPVVQPLPRRESTEGLLVAQLFGGELTGVQYQRAMASLAARDAVRHPITIPGEGA